MKRNHYIAALLLPALLLAGTVKADSNVINGVFTVGNGVTVQFAKGNLQNVCGSSTYTFASSQTTVIGASNTMAEGDAGSTSVKYHGFYYKTHLSDATDGLY